MTKKVTNIDFDGKRSPAVMLRQLADEPELKGIAVICFWDDDAITTGWSNMASGDVLMGAHQIISDVMEEAST